MVDELWAEDPELVIGSEPATRPVGDLGTTGQTWLEFMRFRRYVPEFLHATAAVRTRPNRSLRVRRRLSPLHYVRRVDRRTAAALTAAPAAAALVAGVENAVACSADQVLDVPVVEETLDSAANRAILALLLGLLRRGRALYERLEALVALKRESATETPLAQRWPVRRQLLLDLSTRLKTLLRQSPFAAVRRPEVTAAGLTAVAADPAYSRAWNRGWRALRRGVESAPADERLWISPSWQIYERWCFIRLGKVLGAMTEGWTWRLHGAAERWLGTNGSRNAILEYQPTFRSTGEPRTGRWSVSMQREPDILLTVTGSDPEDVTFATFDAKYRTSRANVLEAMGSAHIYQDSLRIGEARPTASFLLVPRGGGAPWLEDAAFQWKHRVGIVPFSPDTIPQLPSTVLEAIRG
jgi:hypothetical protein